jgi:hypothetical protein
VTKAALTIAITINTQQNSRMMKSSCLWERRSPPPPALTAIFPMT